MGAASILALLFHTTDSAGRPDKLQMAFTHSRRATHMTSDFIFSRAQIQRSHRISAESLGMDFKELVIRLARPISTREVLEDLDTRGLSATECGAIAWATENQDAGFTGGPFRTILWSSLAQDRFAEFLDAGEFYTPKAIARRDAGRKCADIVSEQEAALKVYLADVAELFAVPAPADAAPVAE